MSTVVVIKKNGETAIGADTLTKYGDAKEPAEYIEGYSKILTVHDSKFAFVGHASFGLILESYFSKLEVAENLRNRREVFEAVRKMHMVLKKEYYLVADDEDTFEGADVDCVLANKSGIFGIYGMQNVQEFTKFYAFGSGSSYAFGAMEALYDKDLTAQEIARIALEAACKFDDASGLPIEVENI